MSATVDTAVAVFADLSVAISRVSAGVCLDADVQAARLLAVADQLEAHSSTFAAGSGERTQMDRFGELLHLTVAALRRYRDDTDLRRLVLAVDGALRETRADFGFADVPAGWENDRG